MASIGQSLAALAEQTGLPPEELVLRMGIRDRGLLLEGLAADLVLFDPEHVVDRAAFEDPCQPPVGVSCVVVNGHVVEGGTTYHPGS
jgi:N-acyl-D-amino-acid deacylase